jgi:hypothetical protein
VCVFVHDKGCRSDKGLNGRTSVSFSKYNAVTALLCPSNTRMHGPGVSFFGVRLLRRVPFGAVGGRSTTTLSPVQSPSSSVSSRTSLRSHSDVSASPSTRRRSHRRTVPSVAPVAQRCASTCNALTVPSCPHKWPISSPERRSQTRG